MQFILAAEDTLSQTRTSELDLEEMVDLRQGCRRAAYRASVFIPTEGVVKFSEPVQRLGRLIGTETFQAVYEAAPPTELVDYTISDDNKRAWTNPKPEQITIEALHGRIAWEERFAEAGAPTPEAYIESATEDFSNRTDLLYGSY